MGDNAVYYNKSLVFVADPRANPFRSEHPIGCLDPDISRKGGLNVSVYHDYMQFNVFLRE